jgi:hypothetical protein
MAAILVAAIMISAALVIFVFQTKPNMHDFPISIVGEFRHGEDGKWRCYANVSIGNDLGQDINITWIYSGPINITYADDTFENNWNLMKNSTVNSIIPARSWIIFYWLLTESGFDKEPKTLWVTVQISASGFENITTETVPISRETY